METVEITLDMIRNAPARPTAARGRRKGTETDRNIRSWYESDTPHFGCRVNNSEYGSLQTAIVRLLNPDSDKPKKADYESALENLGLSEVFLAQDGQGTDRVQTLAIVRHDGSDNEPVTSDNDEDIDN